MGERVGSPGSGTGSKKAILIVVAGYLLVLIVLLAAFQLGYLASGPRLSYARQVSSPYAILPSNTAPFSKVTLIPYYDTSTPGSTSFGVRFRLNVTSFVFGSFTSTNGVDIFIFPSDSEGAFWPSLSKGVSGARDFTFSTGIVESGSFNVSLVAATWEIWAIDPSSQNTTLVITQPIQAIALCSLGPVCHPELLNP